VRDPLVLSPSRAARRVACPGSHLLEAKYPNIETEAAREGTAAHWVAAEVLRGNAMPELGSFTPEGEIVTQEMLDGAELYYDHIRGVFKSAHPPVEQESLTKYLHIETERQMPNIHPNCKGTPDCWTYRFFPNEIHLWDYKFGHTPVDPMDNWQLIEYAAGILQYLSDIPYAATSEKPIGYAIHFHIVQPRDYRSANKIKTWVVSVEDLEPYFNTLRRAEAAAMESNAICKPSPECNYCSARHACIALRDTALTIADATMQNLSDDLNDDELGSELRYLEYAQQRLNARITGIKEQVLSQLRNGKRIPFYQLDQGRPRERWTKPPETIAKLGDLFGINLRKIPEVVTPQQAIKAGLPEDITKTNSERPTGEFKVIPINMQKIKKVFST
jgi:uncharacterized protein DUF2800